mmetsp:Transcript_26728/g.39559  ORF Transcript_26728/g.39559 Transcript_26728/m.39559 type:complete len:962 (-) Transcript_26728:1520-4405(-)|eukprot:CAMPEP_0195540808 /NCGR_PEP_ID=MMETSP0794_2-20130614/50761_1 /TAXON_ID=515487 /ORGANISM="Stephanopyxis turris, Strain CCMP 815" /LENGTH=961 /DNA_ID=CAMNT_0040674885 /DNA_START=159 /DNA_END=3044 /DNA_ORIENTATION=+
MSDHSSDTDDKQSRNEGKEHLYASRSHDDVRTKVLVKVQGENADTFIEDLPTIPTDLLSQYTNEKLRALVNDDLYMDIGLQQADLPTLLLTREQANKIATSGEDLDERSRNYKSFLEGLGKDLRQGISKSSKKFRKFRKGEHFWFDALLSQHEDVQEIVLQFMKERNVDIVMTGNVASSGIDVDGNAASSPHTENFDKNDEGNMSNSTADASFGSKKRKRKREKKDKGGKKEKKKSEKKKKKKKDKKVVPTIREEDTEESQMVLSSLPSDIKSRFRQVGFGKWQRDWLPVLELSPYEFADGSDVRDQWMKAYENTMKTNRKMTKLVYWYGVPYERRGQAFSFLPSNNIVPYEKGVEKGYDKISRVVQKKVDKGKKLTQVEEDLVRGLAQIKSDSLLDMSERMAWMKDPVTEIDPNNTYIEEPHEEDSSSDESSEAQHQESDSDDSIEPQPSPRRKKPKKLKTSELLKDEHVNTDEVSNEKDLGTPPDYDEKQSVPLVEDKDDFNSAEESEVEAEAEFSDYGEPVKPPKAKKPIHKRKIQDSNKEKAATKQNEEAAKLERQKEKKRESDRKYKARKKEQEKLNKNISEFLPKMEKLQNSIAQDDPISALKYLKKIEKLIPDVTPAFVESNFQLGRLLKKTRTAFKNSDPQVSAKCKTLTSKLKATYFEKQNGVPEGFIPNFDHSPDLSCNGPKVSPTTRPVTTEVKAKDEPEVSFSSENAAEADEEPKAEAPLPPTETELSNPSASEPSAVPSMTISSIPTKNKVSSYESETKTITDNLPTPTAPAPTSQEVKPARKKPPAFSLKGMLEGPKQPSAKKHNRPSGVGSSRPSAQRKQLPKWLTDPSNSDEARNDHLRNFALDFFHDIASYFPEGKINKTGVALTLEAAVFDWSLKDKMNFPNNYWEKIHDIVSGISGKSTTGTLVKQIIDGEFATPMDLINLPRLKFFESYEGEESSPLQISS